MAAIEKRSGNWRAKVRKSGSPPINKTFTKKSDAVMWAAEIERAIQLGSFGAKDCTVGELLDIYSKRITPAKKSAHIERFWIKRLSRSWLANIQTSKVRPHHIAKYRDERLEEVSASACLKDLNLLSHALNVAAKEWNYNLPSNPVSKIRKPTTGKARTRRLEKGEEERLLDGCMRSTNHWLHPLVMGETPNIAAHLDGLAKPGQVAVGALTQRLIGPAFAFEDLGEHELKGVALPVRAEGSVADTAGRAPEVAPLVGREVEMARLEACWREVKDGAGQIARISGDLQIDLECQAQIAQAGRIKNQLGEIIEGAQYKDGIKQIKHAAW